MILRALLELAVLVAASLTGWLWMAILSAA